METIILFVLAMIVAALCFVGGILLGRGQQRAKTEKNDTELAASHALLEVAERDQARMENELQRQVGAEREAASQRAAVARTAVDEQLAQMRAHWNEQLLRLQSDTAARESQLRSEAERRQLARDEEHDKRVADARIASDQELEAERERSRLRLEEMRGDQKRLADEFEGLSRQALEANSKQFLNQADERFKRSQTANAAELAKREEAVQQLVGPLGKTLDNVKLEVINAEKARLEANAALVEQLNTMRTASEQLTSETKQLVTALRAPQVRGRWGEMQLRRVVEAAGMLNHVDFYEQQSHTTDDGILRPDLVVRLAGDKHVVVDSKVAFSGYLEALEARDEPTRVLRLQAHARQLKKHIDDLSSKSYWEAVSGSPEFVVMFVPAEPFLTAALEEDPTLFEHAFSRNVVIATPSTLVALLRTVGHAWRQEQLAGEAKQIHDIGRELHKRLGTMGGHVATLAKRLNSTVTAYNAFAGSLDRNLVTQARRFSQLQGLEGAIESPVPIEALAIPPQKSDLYGDLQPVIANLIEIEDIAPEAGASEIE
jgi:DNA recombination protein RmuC